MINNLLICGAILASFIAFSSCHPGSGDNKNPAEAPPPVEVMDANGNCTAVAESSFVQAATSLEKYQKDSSEENLTQACNDYREFQALIGEKTCKFTHAEPQMMLSKETLGLSCK
jgi:hypothetical protein